MKIFTLLLATAGFATAANAITYTSTPGAPDPGPLASETWVLDYESGLNGATVTGSYHILNTTINSVAAQPAGHTGSYFAVYNPQIPGNNATLDLTTATGFDGSKVKTFSFYWGSIDNYNTLQVLDINLNPLLTLTGADIFNPANGDQTAANTNQRVYFTLGAGETFGGLTFTSTSQAFEHTDLAVSFVPEPATWAMMISGFGLVGFAARRRRGNALASIAG